MNCKLPYIWQKCFYLHSYRSRLALVSLSCKKLRSTIQPFTHSLTLAVISITLHFWQHNGLFQLTVMFPDTVGDLYCLNDLVDQQWMAPGKFHQVGPDHGQKMTVCTTGRGHHAFWHIAQGRGCARLSACTGGMLEKWPTLFKKLLHILCLLLFTSKHWWSNCIILFFG